MKKILISVDDDIVEILDMVDNKSAFIRKAILADQETNIVSELSRLTMLVDGLVNDMIGLKQQISKLSSIGLSSNGRTVDFDSTNLGSNPSEPAKIAKGSEFVPKPPDPETGYPCCLAKAPCKHWSFNGTEGYWENSLTGKTRDA